MTTIGDTVSRLRNTVKAVKEDAFLTDRFLYSIVLKYAKMFIRRQDNEMKILRFHSLFIALPCIELIEVDKIEACCSGIKSKCIIMRTKDRLPGVLEGVFGPIIRNVYSIDGSVKVWKTYPSIYSAMTNTTTFKYNKNKYYWFLDGYLYFPNIVWESIKVEAMWEDSIEYLKCDGDSCKPRQNDQTHIPDYLFAEIEQSVLKDLGMEISLPMDNQEDKQSILRS